MAGTIPLSLTQQFDEFGKPLSGALLYIIQAGTVSTPQQPYQDASLTILQPNPIQLDAAGRVPQFFLADGYIKVRLDDKFGVTQLARDGILVIGPSAGAVQFSLEYGCQSRGVAIARRVVGGGLGGQQDDCDAGFSRLRDLWS